MFSRKEKKWCGANTHTLNRAQWFLDWIHAHTHIRGFFFLMCECVVENDFKLFGGGVGGNLLSRIDRGTWVIAIVVVVVAQKCFWSNSTRAEIEERERNGKER